eukprot:TRINITY_DN8349_c0_g1_i3.p1 TRINITY_DN8349_c0_g1~~TRINITY_DN8349_c0_g1_i3.p1  ORF type:complete len:149 (-),score=16.99 TRINITY_DN8349_c0_g1_i3:582-1028(-)
MDPLTSMTTSQITHTLKLHVRTCKLCHGCKGRDCQFAVDNNVQACNPAQYQVGPSSATTRKASTDAMQEHVLVASSAPCLQSSSLESLQSSLGMSAAQLESSQINKRRTSQRRTQCRDHPRLAVISPGRRGCAFCHIAREKRCMFLNR